MKRQAYQHPELRDANDNIIQEGTYGKASPLVNGDNTGVLDYINNNLEALYDAQTAAGNAITTGTLTVSGKTTTGTLEASSATVSGQTTTGTLAAGDTTVTGSITTTGLTVTGETSVPTANSDNNSTTIATTAFVQAAIAALVDSAPNALNTLKELATALGNDADFSTTVTNAIAAKVAKAGDTITGPILYDKTPSDGTELVNKSYVDSSISTAHSYIKRNTAYKVGDVLTSPSLPPGCVIVVTTAGTTASTEPDWSSIKSALGGVTTDGTVTFYINDTLSKHSIGDIVYKPLTKTGEHEYLLPLDGQTIDGTKYKRLVDYLGTTTLPNLNGRYLRADNTPGQMVEAGLPNITGKFQKIYTYADQAGAQGAFRLDAYATANGPYENANTNKGLVISVDASRSNTIYGKSTTVTPLTYTVRAYICYA